MTPEPTIVTISDLPKPKISIPLPSAEETPKKSQISVRSESPAKARSVKKFKKPVEEEIEVVKPSNRAGRQHTAIHSLNEMCSDITDVIAKKDNMRIFT